MEKESNRSLQLVLPWYLTYEEGQYVTIETKEYTYVLIYKYYLEGTTNPVHYHVLFNTTDKELYIDSYCGDDGRVVEKIRPSTSSEIGLMDELLRENGKIWDEEKKCIEDIQFPILNFKDWCLARSDKSRPWTPVQFAFVFTDGDGREYLMSCGGISWREWLPMEGNEYLMGKVGE